MDNGQDPQRSEGFEDAGPTRSGEFELDELAGKNGGAEGRRLASYWLSQIISYDDDKEIKRHLKRGSTIERRYRDERNRVDEEGQRRYNALWANVQILMPALYGKTPVPVVERRFKDKDPTGRNASQMLERALKNEIEVNGFPEAMEQAVQDYLLPGQGTVWVRYEPEFEEGVSIPSDSEQDISDTKGDILEDIGEDDHQKEEELEKLRSTSDRIVRESCPVDFIQWTDFYRFPVRARIWKEVIAVGKRVFMTREQMKRRFGPDIGRAIPLQKDDRHQRRQGDTQQGHEVEQKAQVYEIWSRTDMCVYWVAEGYPYLCDRKEDPLHLENFFPCPRPLFANPTSNTLVPVPDFIQYQDQAIQIDELTQRISMLAKACKVAGVYNAAAESIKRLLNESVENELIPVDDWAAFAEKDGVAGNISLLPLKEIMGVIEQLTAVKQQAIEEMDRLTGINDIMRGTSDERETLGGVRLKQNHTGNRLTKRQNEIARFARDTLRIIADIMCQHFSPQSLIEVSGALYEQGLGTMDMPDLSMLQASSTPPPALNGPSPPVGSPVTGGGPPQPPASPPPFSQNPPGQAPQGMGNQAPGQPGPPGPGLPVPQNQPQGQLQPYQQSQIQIPPEMLDKIQGMMRIKRAIDLLRNERLRGFRVDIEVDSSIFGEAEQDREDRTAFLAAMTQFLEQFAMIGGNLPSSVPLLGKFLQFGVRAFPVGRDLEQAIEDFTDSAQEEMKQKAQSQPNPDLIKAQAAQMAAEAKMQDVQVKGQQTQSKMQSDQMLAQQKIQAATMQAQSDHVQAQAEVQRQAIENAGEERNAQHETMKSQMELQMQQIQLQIELKKLEIEEMKARAAMQQSHADIQKTGMDMQNTALKGHVEETKAQNEMEQSHFDMQASKEQHEHDMESQKAAHQQQMKTAKLSHGQAMEKGALDIKKAKVAASKPKPSGSK